MNNKNKLFFKTSIKFLKFVNLKYLIILRLILILIFKQ